MAAAGIGQALAQAPAEPSRFPEVNAAMAAGDGKGPETAYPVPGFLWEPTLLRYRQLWFAGVRKDDATGSDVMTVRGANGEGTTEVWFKPGTPENEEHRRMDEAARMVMGSGDGRTPETAFFVAGNVDVQYTMMGYMGFEPKAQALMRIRGCMFDRHSGTMKDGYGQKTVYFALGTNGRPCRLENE